MEAATELDAPVQVGDPRELCGAEYVEQQAWKSASLERCPLGHKPCRAVGHGSYGRKSPEGIRVARKHCGRCRITIGILPKFLASRVPGTLEEIERTAAAASTHRSVRAAALTLREDHVELAGATRWVRRRLSGMDAIVRTLSTLMWETFEGCSPTLAAMRERIGGDRALLPWLRDAASAHLHALPGPLGWVPRPTAAMQCERRRPQPRGPDPPGSAR